MAEYIGIKGSTIQSLASDPYASEVLAGTWASGNDVNTIRSQTQGCGLLTAGLIAGGNGVPALPSTLGETEEYDGTSWAESGDLNTDRESPGVGGIQTAALCVAGYTTTYTAIVESYDGTSWTTSPATLNSPRTYNIVAGTSTAMITAGGGPGTQDITELWNGSTWTEVGDLNTGRSYFPGGGTSTAGICAGGESPATPQVGTAETWDGTSWTEVNALARAGTSSTRAAMAGNAPNSSTLFFGGSSPVVALTESYNGTSWTEVADMGAARDFGPGGGGSGTSAFWATGKSSPGTKVATTYEFSAPSTVSIAQEGQVWYNTTSTVLKSFGKQGTGAWASAPALNTARGAPGSGGDSVSAMLCNGGDPSPGILTEIYDGSTWSEDADSSTPRTEWGTSWCGTSTATLMATGSSGGPIVTNVEEFNGTSWAAETAAPTAGRGSSGAGTTTAFVMAGGYAPGTSTASFEYNGSAWTTTGAISTGRAWPGGGGSQTAALMIGGAPVAPAGNKTETYDGSTWTEVAATNTKRDGPGLSGGQVAQTTAITFGGSTGSPGGGTVTVNAEQWNGTSWTEVGNLATARRILGSGGPNGTAALAFGGGQPAPSTALTEEFTTPDAIKTFTAS